eukprot:26538_1
MSTNFKWVNVVPKHTKYCVIGYIRRKQKRFPDHKTFYNIPLFVTYIILDYYYERERIRKILQKNIIKLNQKQQIASIRQISDCNINLQHTVYGSLLINFNKPFIYEWDIRVLSLPQNVYGSVITIGIVNSHSLNKICYEYSNYGTIKDESENCLIYAESFHTSDIVSLQINTKMKTLRYFVNDCEYTDCICMKSDKTTYYFAVTMKNNCSIQLLQFNQTYIEK